MILGEPQQRLSPLHDIKSQPQGYLAPNPYLLNDQTSTLPLSINPGHSNFHGNLDLDFDLDVTPPSFSSSPVSTHSIPLQLGSPLPSFERLPSTAIPRAVQEASLFDTAAHSTLTDTSSAALQDLAMIQAESWLPGEQLAPKSAGRFSHQRESSLSSLGSAGPASPYSHNTSNPQIAVTDSMGESYHGLGSNDELNYQLAKFSSANHGAFFPNYPNYTPADAGLISATAYANMTAQPRHKQGAAMSVNADQAASSDRPRPLSVASSVNSDSPATPSGEPDDDKRRKNIFNNAVPKLDRTMTDIYNDELYSPNFSVGGTPAAHIPVSPKNDVFSQRLQAANSQHLSAGPSPVSATPRDKSPFRMDSPLAPTMVQEFPTIHSTGLRFGSEQRLREQRKAVHDTQAAHQQLTQGTETINPPTISPKDAMLDFVETDSAISSMPLFPPQPPTTLPQLHPQFDPLVLDDTSFNNYMTTQLPTGLQVPQQYPFIAQPRHTSNAPSHSSGSMSQSRLGSAELSSSAPSMPNSPQRPAVTTADGGTYTCTYHGCTLRFESPALLQKHKREGHRQAHGISPVVRRPEAAAQVTPGLFNSQAGPHRCDRINPSTGKPCNTIFSRPYDLTRHEDTIHNARKQKVRCDLCTDEKTFSRADALTRHYRVCHPEVELQGKHRRRAHA